MLRGELAEVDSLIEAANVTDGIIHAAFDFSGGDFSAAVAKEVATVRALLNSLEGTRKPLVITSGTAILGDTKDRVFDEDTPVARPPAYATEAGGMSALFGRIAVEKDVLSAKGVHGIVLRPPNVYGRGHGKSVLTMLSNAGRALNAIPYATGTADHKWSFVHVDDLATLYVLALEKAEAGQLFHAAAEVGIKTKDIAEALSEGAGLGGRTVELDSPSLGQALGFPPLAEYWSINSQSSGEKARTLLGWKPQRLDLLVCCPRDTC